MSRNTTQIMLKKAEKLARARAREIQRAWHITFPQALEAAKTDVRYQLAQRLAGLAA